MEDKVFSDYEVRELGFCFGEGDTIKVPCVGSMEEELDVLVISKKCRGVEKKVRARGKGTGTIKISAHVPHELLVKLYAMGLDGLKEGVRAYGQKSLHPEFGLTADVFDEDDNEKLKAYPRCLVKANLSRKTENGAEEVAELELEISVMPDDEGNGMYEALADDIKEETIKTTWMESFTPELVKEIEA
jgi:hypothetical protein